MSDHARTDPLLLRMLNFPVAEAGSPEAEVKQARALSALFALADAITDEDRRRAVLRGPRTWLRPDLYDR